MDPKRITVIFATFNRKVDTKASIIKLVSHILNAGMEMNLNR